MTKKILKKTKKQIFFKQIPKNVLFASLFLFVSGIFLTLQTYNTRQKILGQEKIENETISLINSWKNILSENPGYRDGWFQLSALYYQIGEVKEARDALLMAKTIDPNSETVTLLEEIISNKQ